MGRKKAEQRPDLEKDMFLGLMDHSLAIQTNNERSTYSPWFKEMVVNALNNGMSYQNMHELTDIPIKTLENFKSSVLEITPKKKLLMTPPSLLRGHGTTLF